MRMMRRDTGFKDIRRYPIYTNDEVLYKFERYKIFEYKDSSCYVMVKSRDLEYGRGPIKDITLDEKIARRSLII